jgi:hypothetical protein
MSKYSVLCDSAFTVPLGGMPTITESQMWTDGGLGSSTTAFMEAEPSIVANYMPEPTNLTFSEEPVTDEWNLILSNGNLVVESAY